MDLKIQKDNRICSFVLFFINSPFFMIYAVKCCKVNLLFVPPSNKETEFDQSRLFSVLTCL